MSKCVKLQMLDLFVQISQNFAHKASIFPPHSSIDIFSVMFDDHHFYSTTLTN